MLQRIQTVYLLIIAAFMSVMCFVPLAKYSLMGVEVDRFMAFDYIYVGILFAISALLAFITIWLFKKRMLQIRLCYSQMVLLVGAQAFALFYTIRMTNVQKALGEIIESHMSTVVLFPLACIILNYLAIRAIIKDERLVRSLDRIR